MFCIFNSSNSSNSSNCSESSDDEDVQKSNLNRGFDYQEQANDFWALIWDKKNDKLKQSVPNDYIVSFKYHVRSSVNFLLMASSEGYVKNDHELYEKANVALINSFFYMALIYQHGIGVTNDPEQSVDFFEARNECINRIEQINEYKKVTKPLSSTKKPLF